MIRHTIGIPIKVLSAKKKRDPYSKNGAGIFVIMKIVLYTEFLLFIIIIHDTEKILVKR